MMGGMLGWAEGPPLLRCNVPMIKAPVQEIQFAHTKVKLEDISPLESALMLH